MTRQHGGGSKLKLSPTYRGRREGRRGATGSGRPWPQSSVPASTESRASRRGQGHPWQPRRPLQSKT